MTLRGTTPVPNGFFDKRMVDLSASAIRVYLKIIRNTWGWRDENGNVKQRDWISHSQFGNIGVSSRSVTKAVIELLDYGMIRITDDHGNSLSDPHKRKHAKRVYYTPVALNNAETAYNNEKNASNNAFTREIPTQELRTTKTIYTKEFTAENADNEQKGILTDKERIQRIIEQERRKQNQRDSWS